MAVACLGNMNNNFFSLVRYLRDAGVDAQLLIFDSEFDHFHPSADTFDDSWRDFTTVLDWGSDRGLLRADVSQVRDDLRRFDRLIGCGTAPAYCQIAGRRLDVFAPYGTDILDYPFWRMGLWRRPLRWRSRLALRSAQRAGIRAAGCLLMNHANREYEALFEPIARGLTRIQASVPFVYTPLYDPDTIGKHYPDSRWYPEFRNIRENNDLVVFHHARHVWGPAFRGDPNAKANDVLLRGFAAFCRQSPVRAALVTFEYGKSVADSKALCRQLGIEDRVHWFPLGERKELMVGLSLADVGAGEFAASHLTGGTLYETVAMARPLLQRRDDAEYRGQAAELYPVMHVEGPDDVCSHLLDQVKRPQHYREMGRQGRAWHQRYAVDEPLRRILELLSPA